MMTTKLNQQMYARIYSLSLILVLSLGIVSSTPLLSSTGSQLFTSILPNESPSLNSTVAQSFTLANETVLNSTSSHATALGPIRSTMLESEVATFGAAFNFAPYPMDHYGPGTLYDFSFACEFADGPLKGRPGHVDSASIDGRVTQRSPYENIKRALPMPGGIGHIPFLLNKAMWVTVSVTLNRNYHQDCQFLLWRIAVE